MYIYRELNANLCVLRAPLFNSTEMSFAINVVLQSSSLIFGKVHFYLFSETIANITNCVWGINSLFHRSKWVQT